MNKPTTFWKTLDSKIAYQNRWISLVESNVITPTGKPGTYTVIETRPFVMVIALFEGKFVLVRQLRFTLNRPTLEFPAGSIEDSETPLEAAKRELQEETGYTGEQWETLAELDDAVGIARHKAHVFFARDVRLGPQNESNEDGIESHALVTSDELETMIRQGEITDTKVIALLYLALKKLGDS